MDATSGCKMLHNYEKDVIGLVSNPKYGHGVSSKKIFLPSKHIQYRIPEKTRRGYGVEYAYT